MGIQARKCDMCGGPIEGYGWDVFNENFQKQHGLKQCNKCCAGSPEKGSAIDQDKVKLVKCIKQMAYSNFQIKEIGSPMGIDAVLRTRKEYAKAWLENQNEELAKGIDMCNNQIKQFLAIP